MKYYLCILLLCISFTVSSSDKVDIHHKAITKEIHKVFEEKEAQIIGIEGTNAQLVNPAGTGQFYFIKKDNQLLGYLYVGRVNCCRSGGCSVKADESNTGNFEFFDYLAIFNKEGLVSSMRIFNYQATHGQEICSRAWLKQFKGYDGKQELAIDENIDGISGATVSVYNIVASIENVTQHLISLLAL